MWLSLSVLYTHKQFNSYFQAELGSASLHCSFLSPFVLDLSSPALSRDRPKLVITSLTATNQVFLRHLVCPVSFVYVMSIIIQRLMQLALSLCSTCHDNSLGLFLNLTGSKKYEHCTLSRFSSTLSVLVWVQSSITFIFTVLVLLVFRTLTSVPDIHFTICYTDRTQSPG